MVFSQDRWKVNSLFKRALKHKAMSTSSSPDKDAEKRDDKVKKNPNPKLNRDINKQVQEERFPEAILSKNPRKDTETQKE